MVPPARHRAHAVKRALDAVAEPPLVVLMRYLYLVEARRRFSNSGLATELLLSNRAAGVAAMDSDQR
jgi:hypothetical protein